MDDDSTNSFKSTPSNDSPQGVTDGAQISEGGTQETSSPIARQKSTPYSDTYNAQAFVQAYGRNLRYCWPWGKWLVWQETHWQLDTSGAVIRYAISTIKQLKAPQNITQSDSEDMETINKSFYAHRKQSHNASRLDAMIRVAQSLLDIPVQPADLDKDPWLLNCRNGTLNLQTGELRSHKREDLITKCLPVEYDPLAQCPLWVNFLNDIMARNERLLTFLQRAIGYALTGDVREQVLFILYGAGSNGKSVFLNTIMTMLREYAMKASAELLMASKYYDRHPTEKADLHSKRFVAAIETEQGRLLNEVLVKELTGSDPIRARRMREDHWQFWPTHKVFLATNHLPSIKGTDHAIWRRLKVIPFNVTILNAQQDKLLPEKLKAELAGILTWAVQGCLAWQREGLGEPTEVQQATVSYRAEMDTVGQFITECCLVGPECKARATELYNAYKAWCAGNGEQAEMSQLAFGAVLSTKDYERYTSNGTWYRGLKLRVREDKREA